MKRKGEARHKYACINSLLPALGMNIMWLDTLSLFQLESQGKSDCNQESWPKQTLSPLSCFRRRVFSRVEKVKPTQALTRVRGSAAHSFSSTPEVKRKAEFTSLALLVYITFHKKWTALAQNSTVHWLLLSIGQKINTNIGPTRNGYTITSYCHEKWSLRKDHLV